MMLLRLDATTTIDCDRVIAVKARANAAGVRDPRGGSVIVLTSPKGRELEYVDCTLSPGEAHMRITQALRGQRA